MLSRVGRPEEKEPFYLQKRFRLMYFKPRLILWWWATWTLLTLIDRTSPEDGTPAMVTERSLSDMSSSLQLTDVWKKLKQQQPGHTFHHKSGSSRIDRFYVSSAIAPHCGDMTVCPVAFTDHCAIILQLSNQQQNARQRSRGHWKLNVSILQDEEYRLRVSKAIQRASTHSKRWY